MVNYTCNSTLDDLRIGMSEVPIVHGLTFHALATLVGGASTIVAIIVSGFLIMMHALHYTKPDEQRHIIRILFMVPVYAAASFLCIIYYWYETYYEVISECYEAFAIASFFALMCHYIAPTVHDQKNYFREISPKEWVLPLNWFAKCFRGQKGPFRTPRSGLTWFNIIWFGVYQYCFVRVTMTVTAVVTQYFHKYCSSSWNPLFAHVWIMIIESTAVTVAMFCLIQFYVQLSVDLAEKKPFVKVIAIKLVIFLSFWQSVVLSLLTSDSLGPIITTTQYVAYPDMMVGVPNLLLCLEMMIFAVLHLFAFPWQPYRTSGARTDDGKEGYPKQGGFLGLKAFADAMNPWDLVKAFARGARWAFVGRKSRENDVSYRQGMNDVPYRQGLNDVPLDEPVVDTTYKGNGHLPIADEFRRSNFALNYCYTPGKDDDTDMRSSQTSAYTPGKEDDTDMRSSQTSESLGLISHAQPSPSRSPSRTYQLAHTRYDSYGLDSPRENQFKTLRPVARGQPFIRQAQVDSVAGEIGTAFAGHDSEPWKAQPPKVPPHRTPPFPRYANHDAKDEPRDSFRHSRDSEKLQQMQPTHQQGTYAMPWGPQAQYKEERGIQ